MTQTDCASIRRHLEAFVDGELRGPDVLRVLQHIEACADCTAEADEFQRLGELLRVGAPRVVTPHEFDGLASTVISRTKAEAAESWSGVFLRAREDWHWLVVGAGSVAATFVSIVTLSAILAFGPKPTSEDSLSGIMANLATPIPAGFLFLDVAPVGTGLGSVIVQADNGSPVASLEMVEQASTGTADGQLTEAQVVGALAAAVTRNGRVVRLDQMDRQDRRYTESLMREIIRRRSIGPAPMGVSVNVFQLRLVAFDERVTASKGL